MLISTKPFIFVLFLVGVTVQSAESLSAAIPLGTSTKRANSKRANHGRSRLFQDSVPSVSFWLRSFPSGSWVISLVRPTGRPAFHSVCHPWIGCRSQHRGMGSRPLRMKVRWGCPPLGVVATATPDHLEELSASPVQSL